MDFEKVLNVIARQRGHGAKKNNIAEVKKTAVALGLSKNTFKTIHIAGTNGKGTTATILALSLKNAGFKTGLFVSPHVNCVTERIRIDNKNISKKDFTFYIKEVLKKETVPLKFFEILTLAALLYFERNKIDYAVIECGIGARRDCTNIVKPALSIITSVDKDHTSILGSDIKDIALEKAGVIKKSTPCLLGNIKPAARKVIAAQALKNKAPLLKTGKSKIISVSYKSGLTKFIYGPDNFKIKLLGQAQAANACLALAALDYFKIPFYAAKAAFEQINMPWRFEVRRFGKKYIIADGAHNPAALKEFVKTYTASPFYGKGNTLIFASMADKDYKKAVKMLRPYFNNIVLPVVDKNKGVPPAELKKLFKKEGCLEIQKLTKEDIKKLSGNIVICGSFYLRSKIPVFSS